MLSAGFVLVVITIAAPQAVAGQRPPAQSPGNADAQAVAAFLDRVNAYAAIHEKLESKTPKLPDERSPKQIDDRQRAFAQLLQTARPQAKQGDMFTPAMTALARRVLNRIFAGPDGKQLLSSIMDENPVDIRLTVNRRYPESVPLATMPPEVLMALPELPEALEYRFIGDDLILLDPHAQLIVDFVPDALPGR
jgi:hypothetical protein